MESYQEEDRSLEINTNCGSNSKPIHLVDVMIYELTQQALYIHLYR
jgi:hypothetical protein